MEAWHYLESLCRLGPRGSGTDGERRAAAWLSEQLAALGYAVEIQPFRCPRHTLYLGPAAVIAGVLMARALAGWSPPLGLALMILMLVPLVGEMLGARLNFDLLLPKGPSQNVVAQLKPGAPVAAPPGGASPTAPSAAGEGPSAGTTVVIAAHYDTQRGTWLFAPAFRPWLRPFFVTVYAALALAPLGTALGWAFPGARWAGLVADGATVWLAATGAFLVLAWATGRDVQGANDNGSGVAVALALARRWGREPIPGLNPLFLFTGCEEAGTRGMRHFLAAADLPAGTVFLNLDNVGGGRLRYLQGEGMLVYRRYDPELVALARRVAARVSDAIAPLENLLLPTDALPVAVAGFPVLTLLAAGDDGGIPHYHWHTDVLENAERAVVELTEAFAWALLQALGRRVSRGGEQGGSLSGWN
ncbi:MAG: M28 family peptidase [Limnochordales bacterium]